MLRGSIMAKKYFIEVDLAHLMSFDEGLANDLKDAPARHLAEVCLLQTVFNNSPDEIDAHYSQKYMTV